MNEAETSDLLENGQDWERRETSIPGVFVVKLPKTETAPAFLSLEFNPLNKYGRPKKRKGLFLTSIATASAFVNLLKKRKLKALMKQVDKVNSDPKLQNALRLAHSLTAKGGQSAKNIPGNKRLKWEIDKYKIINLALYEFVEVADSEAAGEKRIEELYAEGYEDDFFLQIKVVRAKYKGKSPFDADGVCYAIYRFA
ncbi:MAG: hypothetical protein ACTSU5_00555 [Promethearchaeota archaeon]